MTDPMAERIRKRGGTTLRSVGHIGRMQTIRDNDAGFVGAHAMLDELPADNRSLVEGLRAARELAEREGDSPTSSLIDDWIDQAEQRVWFLTLAVAEG